MVGVGVDLARRVTALTKALGISQIGKKLISITSARLLTLFRVKKMKKLTGDSGNVNVYAISDCCLAILMFQFT